MASKANFKSSCDTTTLVSSPPVSFDVENDRRQHDGVVCACDEERPPRKHLVVVDCRSRTRLDRATILQQRDRERVRVVAMVAGREEFPKMWVSVSSSVDEDRRFGGYSREMEMSVSPDLGQKK